MAKLMFCAPTGDTDSWHVLDHVPILFSSFVLPVFCLSITNADDKLLEQRIYIKFPVKLQKNYIKICSMLQVY
jgi:hypothetical protein